MPGQCVRPGPRRRANRRFAAVLDRHVILRTAWIYSEFGSNFLKTILRLAYDSAMSCRWSQSQHGAPTAAREIADAILHIAPRLITR